MSPMTDRPADSISAGPPGRPSAPHAARASRLLEDGMAITERKVALVRHIPSRIGYTTETNGKILLVHAH